MTSAPVHSFGATSSFSQLLESIQRQVVEGLFDGGGKGVGGVNEIEEESIWHKVRCLKHGPAVDKLTDFRAFVPSYEDVNGFHKTGIDRDTGHFEAAIAVHFHRPLAGGLAEIGFGGGAFFVDAPAEEDPGTGWGTVEAEGAEFGRAAGG